MNDTVMKMFKEYERKYKVLTKKVTKVYNFLWGEVLEEYYKDSFGYVDDNKKYYVYYRDCEETNTPYATTLLVKMLTADGFVNNQYEGKCSISRAKINEIIKNFKEEENRTVSSK